MHTRMRSSNNLLTLFNIEQMKAKPRTNMNIKVTCFTVTQKLYNKYSKTSVYYIVIFSGRIGIRNKEFCSLHMLLWYFLIIFTYYLTDRCTQCL